MKILKIKRCFECPSFGVVHNTNESHYYCHKLGKRIENYCVNELQKWCPLPDYKEDEQV
ncbi:unnamed protein product [marine sediment metagenome]|uniref:Uncharacterized protein n=1 Tax=marine sediment metagenome TaxID=412755 RepID=X0VPG9_9ZZZZ